MTLRIIAYKKYVIGILIFLAFLGKTAFAQITSDDLAKAALSLENRLVLYDGSYRQISYPMGDVPSHIGVCSDVVIRAYRELDIDLQQLVHEDMRDNFDLYPKIWGLSSTDKNIDHRRVPNLRVYFKRHGITLPVTNKAGDYKPGHIVTWNLRENGSLPHIGIVTDRKSRRTGNPLIMHNIGGGQVLEDMLFKYQITGHYTYAINN